ncbi:hypothetical protein INR49_026113 [Caranx melampygus]|nr:hypothetical protein INR49_026113 [Caranx melampygus]
MEKQQREQVDRNIKEAKEKLEAELESAKHEHQLIPPNLLCPFLSTSIVHLDLMRRQEELRRLEELRNQELQRRKQIEMRHEEERRRREEEMMRHREQEDLRRQPEGFKPNYLDNACFSQTEKLTVFSDGYNQANAGPTGNQGQMMGMSGRGGAIGPEGTANMGTPLMSENGAMVTEMIDTRRVDQWGVDQKLSPQNNNNSSNNNNNNNNNHHHHHHNCSSSSSHHWAPKLDQPQDLAGGIQSCLLPASSDASKAQLPETELINGISRSPASLEDSGTVSRRASGGWMDNMSPQQQQQDSLSRGGGQHDNKRRMKSQSYRRQSAPSLVITKALTRSKTLSRESFLVPVSPETCPLVQSFLSGSDRSFLLHGHAQLKTGMQTQDRHLFLFTDILVIAKAKSANHFKQKAQVLIREEKEKEEPKTIPLRVYGKGINTFAVTKTLPVSNSDSTNEVIRLALQQFSIIGNVKDFQLWVISKRDNAPYPLIGHEFPFSIQMSHVRHNMSQGGGAGGRDAAATSPADRQKVTQVEQLQVYKHCQFILKPRPVEPLQQHAPADFSQKPFKRRRSLITWAFWRGSSSHLNELSLAGAPHGCLFAQSLSSICVDDALPKPVMVSHNN